MNLIKKCLKPVLLILIMYAILPICFTIQAKNNPADPTPTLQPPGDCVCGHPGIHLLTCVPVESRNNCREDLAPNCLDGPLCNSCSCILPQPTGGASTGYRGSDPYCAGSESDTEDPKINTAIGCIPVTLDSFIFWLLPRLFSIIGGIAFLIIIFGFILLITSEGDPKKIQAAKDTITSAIIGLLFAIFSLFILRLIVLDILHFPGIKPPSTIS
jgi:hypothetical protein